MMYPAVRGFHYYITQPYSHYGHVHFSGVECYHSADGTDYRGSKAETEDGRQCLAWDQSLSAENNPQA